MPSSEPSANVLLVEGVDDKHVVQHLSSKLAPNLQFDCLEKEGIDQLLKAIPVEMKVSGRRAVGILMDANDSPEARWQAIANCLNAEGVTLPKAPVQGGAVIPASPRIGVWLMPDNQSGGELEDFVVQLLPQDDPVWPLAGQFIDSIPQEHRKFPQQKEQRARLHAWLATRQAPMKMGAAIGTESLDPHAQIATRFADWLAKLFGQHQ